MDSYSFFFQVLVLWIIFQCWMFIWMFKSRLYFCFACMLYCTCIELVYLFLACILLSKHCFPFSIFFLLCSAFWLIQSNPHKNTMLGFLLVLMPKHLPTPHIANALSLPRSVFTLWHCCQCSSHLCWDGSFCSGLVIKANYYCFCHHSCLVSLCFLFFLPSCPMWGMPHVCI